LKALAALGPAPASTDQIADLLWPDADGDIAAASLKTTLHRLRKLLGLENAIRLHDGKLSIDSRCCYVDAHHFEALAEAAQERQDNAASRKPTDADALRHALDVYLGPAMPNESTGWIISTRERLHARYLKLALTLGAIYETSGDWDAAGQVYERTLVIDPIAEVLYIKLMAALRKQNRLAEAVQVYERCESQLRAAGKVPSPAVREYRAFLKIA
jgi:DNA-binding SARP family transcriptional activator